MMDKTPTKKMYSTLAELQTTEKRLSQSIRSRSATPEKQDISSDSDGSKWDDIKYEAAA